MSPSLVVSSRRELLTSGALATASLFINVEADAGAPAATGYCDPAFTPARSGPLELRGRVVRSTRTICANKQAPPPAFVLLTDRATGYVPLLLNGSMAEYGPIAAGPAPYVRVRASLHNDIVLRSLVAQPLGPATLDAPSPTPNFQEFFSAGSLTSPEAETFEQFLLYCTGSVFDNPDCNNGQALLDAAEASVASAAADPLMMERLMQMPFVLIERPDGTPTAVSLGELVEALDAGDDLRSCLIAIGLVLVTFIMGLAGIYVDARVANAIRGVMPAFADGAAAAGPLIPVARTAIAAWRAGTGTLRLAIDATIAVIRALTVPIGRAFVAVLRSGAVRWWQVATAVVQSASLPLKIISVIVSAGAFALTVIAALESCRGLVMTEEAQRRRLWLRGMLAPGLMT